MLTCLGGRIKSLVLWGPSKTGKTTWARMIGDHMYHTEFFNAKQASLAETVAYAVFDDMKGGISGFGGWRNWMGGQPTVQVKLLYKEPELLKWGKPLIWCNNRDPRDQLREAVSIKYHGEQCEADIEWLEENCIFVHVDRPIISQPNTE